MSKYRPPHSDLSVLFSGPKETARKERENRVYREARIKGKGFRDGSR